MAETPSSQGWRGASGQEREDGVPKERLELSRAYAHGALNTACLPIPPLRQGWRPIEPLWRICCYVNLTTSSENTRKAADVPIVKLKSVCSLARRIVNKEFNEPQLRH